MLGLRIGLEPAAPQGTSSFALAILQDCHQGDIRCALILNRLPRLVAIIGLPASLRRAPPLRPCARTGSFSSPLCELFLPAPSFATTQAIDGPTCILCDANLHLRKRRPHKPVRRHKRWQCKAMPIVFNPGPPPRFEVRGRNDFQQSTTLFVDRSTSWLQRAMYPLGGYNPLGLVEQRYLAGVPHTGTTSKTGVSVPGQNNHAGASCGRPGDPAVCLRVPEQADNPRTISSTGSARSI